jgi:hypothetical protein
LGFGFFDIFGFGFGGNRLGEYEGSTMVLNDVSPSEEGLTIVVHRLMRGLATGEKFVVRLNKGVDGVPAVIKLKGDGEDRREKPGTVVSSFMFVKFDLCDHGVGALAPDSVPQGNKVAPKLETAGNVLFDFFLKDKVLKSGQGGPRSRDGFDGFG